MVKNMYSHTHLSTGVGADPGLQVVSQ